MFCRRLGFLLLVVFFFGSCANKPKEILSMSEMTNILVDLNKAEALFETERFRGEITQEQQYHYRLGILEKHGSNQAQLDSSIVWYNRDPKKLDKIFFRVLGKLEEQKLDIEKNPITEWRKSVPRKDPRNITWYKHYLKQVASPEELNFSPHKYSIERSSDSLLRQYNGSSLLFYKIREKEKIENQLWLETEYKKLYRSQALGYNWRDISPAAYCDTLLQKHTVRPAFLEQTEDPVLINLNRPKPLMLP